MGKEKGMKIWREIIRQGRRRKNATTKSRERRKGQRPKAYLGVHHQLRRAEEEKDIEGSHITIWINLFIYLSIFLFKY